MVRNTKGGTGTKGLARKHQNNNGSVGKSRLPSCELEMIAICTKMLGNGMCQITTSTNLNLLCHIRNKFRGQHKRQNSISVLSLVLIGLREWETVPKNCDILYIYDEREVESFNSNPALKLTSLFNIRNGGFNNNNNNNSYNDHDLFSTQTFDDKIDYTTNTNTNTNTNINTDNNIDINTDNNIDIDIDIDDI